MSAGLKYSPVSQSSSAIAERLMALPSARDRDLYLREILRELVGALEDLVGLQEVSGIISLVGARISELVDSDYRRGLGKPVLEPGEIAAVLVDFQRRINGGFAIEHIDDEKIVFINSTCPFGRSVTGRPSLCMMTSTLFGRIAAENLGYAGVTIDQAIARGDQRCRVVVALAPQPGGDAHDTHEYFAVNDRA